MNFFKKNFTVLNKIQLKEVYEKTMKRSSIVLFLCLATCLTLLTACSNEVPLSGYWDSSGSGAIWGFSENLVVVTSSYIEKYDGCLYLAAGSYSISNTLMEINWKFIDCDLNYGFYFGLENIEVFEFTRTENTLMLNLRGKDYIEKLILNHDHDAPKYDVFNPLIEKLASNWSGRTKSMAQEAPPPTKP